jgi:hypothetical protein
MRTLPNIAGILGWNLLGAWVGLLIQAAVVGPV